MARVGLEEQGESQRDLQQPSSPHGAAGRHSLRRRRAFQRPASPGSRCLAVSLLPLSCYREVPAWVLPLSSLGTAPTSGSPCPALRTHVGHLGLRGPGGPGQKGALWQWSLLLNPAFCVSAVWLGGETVGSSWACDKATTTEAEKGACQCQENLEEQFFQGSGQATRLG